MQQQSRPQQQQQQQQQQPEQLPARAIASDNNNNNNSSSSSTNARLVHAEAESDNPFDSLQLFLILGLLGGMVTPSHVQSGCYPML